MRPASAELASAEIAQAPEAPEGIGGTDMAGAWPCTVTIEIRHRIGNLPRVMTRTCLRLQRLQERGAAWSEHTQAAADSRHHQPCSSWPPVRWLKTYFPDAVGNSCTHGRADIWQATWQCRYVIQNSINQQLQLTKSTTHTTEEMTRA